MFAVKYNKQFNSDSQRLALSLRVELSVYGAVFKFSVCAAHTLTGRYVAGGINEASERYQILVKRLSYCALVFISNNLFVPL